MRAAIVLAAGASSRMGQPKALLAWRDGTLLEYVVQQAREAGVEGLVVVLGPSTRAVEVPHATVAFNLDESSGRAASIRIGASAVTHQPGAVLVQSVDQPVPASVLRALFEAVERAGAEIAQPTCAGQRGHPVCFSGALLTELRNVQEHTQGLRAITHAHPVQTVAVDTRAVLWNLNDPDAYARARNDLA